jgi:hypothetical protein
MYRRGRENTLFWDRDLSATLDHHAKTAKDKVDAINQDQFLATPIDDVVAHIVNDLYVRPLELHEDRAEMDQQEVRVDVSHNRNRNPFGDSGPIMVPGIKVTISIPYTGDPSLWKLKPNQWRSTIPHGDIRSPNRDGVGYLDIVIQQPADDPQQQIKAHLEDVLNGVRFYINGQSSQIKGHNEALELNVLRLVEARRERLSKHDGLADFLNIPMKRNSSAPSFKPIDIKKNLVKPLPPPPRSGYKAEPGITADDYEHILSVIRHEGATFEATPRTYAVHDEEELRDIILAHLNGHYKGAATGEAFRKLGKTDIKIESDNRAAFIAECKVWRGASELSKAIDQLLGYLTWRDCKASIIIFNKHNKKFTELLEKTPEIFKSHPRFKKHIKDIGEGEWHYEFMSKDDDSRLIQVRVYVFDIYHDSNT